MKLCGITAPSLSLSAVVDGSAMRPCGLRLFAHNPRHMPVGGPATALGLVIVVHGWETGSAYLHFWVAVGTRATESPALPR